MAQPNILYVMTDQQRFDTIAGLGNSHIYTPNLDRLVRRGLSFSRGYSTCPVCVAARYTVRTGCEPPRTRRFSNGVAQPVVGQADTMTGRCGPYLAQTMQGHGYRTFGVGKFHTGPWDEDIGYDVHLRSEELYGSPEQRAGDASAAWIAKEHPRYDYIEALQGERTEMYYMPQVSPLPAHATVESWAADRTVEQLQVNDGRPFFGFVSFIGPHPPFAPPVPFNRMYDPDRMPNPIYGDIASDHADEQIPFMNRIIWADDITDSHARVLKARYYGEISYIDECLGRILDEVEARPDADSTLICFFSDHGDHLGDHCAWQKESFFDASCHIPFLVSWPASLPADECRDELVCLTDLFGIATHAAGKTETRDGSDILAMLTGDAPPRESVIGMYGVPGTPQFKVMVRREDWKYIYIANGGREQLFNLAEDHNELTNRASSDSEKVTLLRKIAITACEPAESGDALDANGLRSFLFEERERRRIHQFDRSRGITGFPDRPEDVVRT